MTARQRLVSCFLNKQTSKYSQFHFSRACDCTYVPPFLSCFLSLCLSFVLSLSSLSAPLFRPPSPSPLRHTLTYLSISSLTEISPFILYSYLPYSCRASESYNGCKKCDSSIHPSQDAFRYFRRLLEVIYSKGVSSRIYTLWVPGYILCTRVHPSMTEITGLVSGYILGTRVPCMTEINRVRIRVRSRYPRYISAYGRNKQGWYPGTPEHLPDY